MQAGTAGRGAIRAGSWSLAIWGCAAALLLLPLVAMQFTREVNWTASDFLVMGALVGVVALGMDLLTRRSGSVTYRFGAVLALLSALLIVWVNLAVGMIGDEDNLYNFLFLGMIALAAIGAVAARFRPAGMARAIFVAATAHVLVAVLGMSSDMRGAVLSIAMASLWLGSASLFSKAGRQALAG